MSAYPASQVRALLARGPAEGEDFYRLKAAGNGETRWFNVSPAQLRAIAHVIDDEFGRVGPREDEPPRESIRALLNYNWADEERDYEQSIENGDISPDPLQRSLSGHIFDHMRVIDAWLGESG